MNPMVRETNKLLIERVITALKTRNMEGFYADNKEEALKKVKELLVGAKTIAHGGSETLREIGAIEEFTKGPYEYLNKIAMDTRLSAREAYLKAYEADCYLGSVNAISEDGVIVNIDGNSNRISAYAYGPKKVIFVVGAQKIVKDVDMAIKRARNVAAPTNSVRLSRETPCTKYGSCMNCKLPDTICCNIMLTRYERDKDRVKVILVNDDLGF